MREKVSIAGPLSNTNFSLVGSPSILDIFSLKCNFTHTVPVALPVLSSNHNPVEIEINYKHKYNGILKFYDYSKVNWNVFREQLNQDINLGFHINSGEQLEEKCATFMEILNEAISDNIPFKKICLNVLKLPNYIESLIKLKNKLRKQSQHRPTISNKIYYIKIEKLV